MACCFGRRPVLEMLKGRRRVTRIILAKNTKGHIIDEIISLATEQGIPLQMVSRHYIESKFKGFVHQGIIAESETDYLYKSGSKIEEILYEIRKKDLIPFFLILDSIEDPRNLGALIRTANGAGIHGIIIPKHRSAGITPLVKKASAGAVETIPVLQVSNLVQTCKFLKKNGIWIVGADASVKDKWFQVDMTCPLAIVLGGEGKGIRRLLKEECDFIVTIPMTGRVESLNVSVAGGILMYEALRQRMIKKLAYSSCDR